MKRIGLIVSMMGLFLLTAVGTIGCDVDTQTATEGLTNSVGDGNGPGSGNWKPNLPTNNRQAQRMHAILQELTQRANQASAKYDEAYPLCLDEKGEWSQNGSESCVQEMNIMWEELRALFLDYRSGSQAYIQWAQQNQDLNPPDLPDSPKPPLSRSPAAWTGCLTCTHQIDNAEFAFFDLELSLAD